MGLCQPPGLMAVLSCLPPGPAWLGQWVVLSCLKIQGEDGSRGLGDIGQWFEVFQTLVGLRLLGLKSCANLDSFSNLSGLPCAPL